MKSIKYSLIALFSLLLMTSCFDEKYYPTYNASNATAPMLSALNSSYVLLKENEANAFTTFNFTKANWDDENLATVYTLQTSLTSDFAKTYDLGTSTNPSDLISMSVNTKDINTILINKLIQPGKATSMYFRVLANVAGISATVSGIKTLVSKTVSAMITPYDMDIVYPKVYLPGDYNGWKFDPQYLFSFDSNNVYGGVVDFGSNYATFQWGFKITGAASWDNSTGNWGAATDTQTADSPTLTLQNNGKNITAYQGRHRFYHFTFTKVSLDAPTLAMDYYFDKLSIIGSGVNGDTNWTTDIDFNFDTAKQRFTVDCTLTTGEIKIRANHGWTMNWGGSNGVLKTGGDNIKVVAGKYRVIVNMNNSSNMTYSLISLD